MVLVATQVKRRRGTTAENDAFTGAEGEITVDTEKHELRVHDGVTRGGFKIPTAESLDFASKSLDNLSSNGEARFTAKVDKGHELIDFQIPTAGGGHTWYRKYADGWVEQGVINVEIAPAIYTFNFPIPMANTNYAVMTSVLDALNTTTMTAKYDSKATTGIKVRCTYQNGLVRGDIMVCGMSA